MLVENQKVEVRWNNNNKIHYVGKGYLYTKNGDIFLVDVNDLMKSTKTYVDVICDYCGEIYKTEYCNYIKGLKNIKKSCCGKQKCKSEKAGEVTRLCNYKKFSKFCTDNDYEPITQFKDYFGSSTKMKYICKIHGTQSSTLDNILHNNGICHQCKMDILKNDRKYSDEEILKVVNEKENISLLNINDYKNFHEKNLVFKCNTCGNIFVKSLDDFKMSKYGCNLCANKNIGNSLRYTKEDVINIVQLKNNNKCQNPDEYIGSNVNNILVKCGSCNKTFKTSISNYNRNKTGKCPECNKIYFKNQYEEKQSFILYNNFLLFCKKYNHIPLSTQNDFKKTFVRTTVHFICKKHGKQNLSYQWMMNGGICRPCAMEKMGINKRLSKDQLIKNIYSKNKNILLNPEDYEGATKQNLKIKCSECGEIYTTSYSSYMFTSITGRCKKCTGKMSEGEYIVEKILNKYNVLYDWQAKLKNCKDKDYLPFDFYLPDYNTCIEFDGQQHFEPVFGEKSFFRTLLHDGMKNNYCKWNNIKLVRIPYWKGHNIEEILIKELNLTQQKLSA